MLKVKISRLSKELLKWNRKTLFLVSKVLFFRHKKQTSKNVADGTFKFYIFKISLTQLFNYFEALECICAKYQNMQLNCENYMVKFCSSCPSGMGKGTTEKHQNGVFCNKNIDILCLS